MSEEQNEEGKKRSAGGSFEQGLKSALEKAPAMVVPSWATMQTAMAGGAAGGAAAASWRWIIGPAASAALIGGVFWFGNRGEKQVRSEQAIEMVEDVAPSEVLESDERAGAWIDNELVQEVAEDKGLKKGDVIIQVNRIKISSTDELYKLNEEAKKAKKTSVLMLILRNGMRRFIGLPTQ